MTDQTALTWTLKYIITIVLLIGMAGTAWAGEWDGLFYGLHPDGMTDCKYIAVVPEEVSNNQRYGDNDFTYAIYYPPTRIIYTVRYFKTLSDILSYLKDKPDSYQPEVYEVKPVYFKCEVSETRSVRQVEDVRKKYNWKITEPKKGE